MKAVAASNGMGTGRGSCGNEVSEGGTLALGASPVHHSRLSSHGRISSNREPGPVAFALNVSI